MQTDSITGYDKIAHDYDKGRPDYPKEILPLLIAALGLQPKSKVLDLAAGTGKVTKFLAPLGLDLCAVEPVAEMRAIFSKEFPKIPIFNGTAEKIPLPDQTIDTILVGTAFHWFDGEKAVAEMARVLKPGGKLGLLWSIRALESSWVKAIWTVLERYDKNPSHDKMIWREGFDKTTLFSPLNHQKYCYSYKGGVSDILAHLFSIKLMGVLTPENKEIVISEVLNIIANDSDTKNKETFDIPYKVEFYWCQRNP